MYLISGKRDNTYAVLDTSDGIAEYYTKEQVLTFKQNGINIAGVTPDGRIFILDANLAYLWYAQRGTPLKIKLTKDLFWRQALYIDCIVSIGVVCSALHLSLLSGRRLLLISMQTTQS